MCIYHNVCLIYILLTELELIKEVYRDMLDVAVEYSETAGGRYILSMPELRDSSTIYNYYVDLVDKIHDKVDRYALCVDTKTIKKLHIILMEYKQDIVDEPTPERWINNNIDYYKAKRLLLFYKKIGDHSVENNIYGIKDVEPELFDEDAGFETKDTLEDLLKKRLQGLGKKVINQCYITSLRELYLREFAETMMTIFNMDFDLRR